MKSGLLSTMCALVVCLASSAAQSAEGGFVDYDSVAIPRQIRALPHPDEHRSATLPIVGALSKNFQLYYIPRMSDAFLKIEIEYCLLRLERNVPDDQFERDWEGNITVEQVSAEAMLYDLRAINYEKTRMAKIKHKDGIRTFDGTGEEGLIFEIAFKRGNGNRLFSWKTTKVDEWNFHSPPPGTGNSERQLVFHNAEPFLRWPSELHSGSISILLNENELDEFKSAFSYVKQSCGE